MLCCLFIVALSALLSKHQHFFCAIQGGLHKAHIQKNLVPLRVVAHFNQISLAVWRAKFRRSPYPLTTTCPSRYDLASDRWHKQNGAKA
jgi:hypothetical protein